MKESIKVDTNTEEKIKEAARTVFHKKGFAATRTRDIAEEAGINLALLNYYFRSKEKLFNIIMMDTMQSFFKHIQEVFNNETSSLENKIESLVHNYIDLLIKNPEIPLFILSELRTNPDAILDKIGAEKVIMQSVFIKQFIIGIQEGRIRAINPIHYIINLMSMTIFPFVASPMIKGIGNFSDKEFNDLVLERKELIPKWINLIMKT